MNLKEEIRSHKKINDQTIRYLLDSLEVKIRGIRDVYLNTGYPPLWMIDFTHEAIALMNQMSFVSQINNIEAKVGAQKALPLPSKKLTKIGGTDGNHGI